MRLPTLLLHGPAPALPRPLDALADRWARLGPRVRMLAVLVAVIALLTVDQVRVGQAEERWGGQPVRVLVADRDLAAGSGLDDVRALEVPPTLAPPGAVPEAPQDQTLTAPLPEGSVLTTTHLDPAGPGAGLGPDRRALPIPVEEGWGVTAGGWVDVWVLGEDHAAERVATARPVLAVTEDGQQATALVELDAAEVGPATGGLALGRLLLAHAPAPASVGDGG